MRLGEWGKGVVVDLGGVGGGAGVNTIKIHFRKLSKK